MPAAYWELTVPVSADVSEGLTNLVWELGALGVVEDNTLRAFFPPDVEPEALRVRVGGYLDGLRALGFAVTDAAPGVAPLAEAAWTEAWKTHFRPVHVGARFLVAPPWDVPRSPRVVLVIEPGRAFGTGHHGSTAGCLALLERAVSIPPPARALDLGTGSGILAIAAARLGVSHVLAVDCDPDAVAAGGANALLNGVADRVEVLLGDAIAVRAAPGVPLVLANLLAADHRRLANNYRALVAARGSLILGGILESEADDLAAALADAGFGLADREVSDGWSSLQLIPA